MVSSRIAFSRRVGYLIESARESAGLVRRAKVRFAGFDLIKGAPAVDPGELLQGIDVGIDLENPDFEYTLVRGNRNYLGLTRPGMMKQRWSERRPRARPFFHPSAMFPKLSRALVNLSRCREGETLLDPFCGTGSLPIEAAAVGARVVAADLAGRMTKGARANMTYFGQSSMGVVRADALSSPFRAVDAIVADVPYGRASSTLGTEPGRVVQRVLPSLSGLLARGSRMVLMHSDRESMPAAKDLVLEERHHLYVHKLLTRTVSVLRRR